LHPKQHLPGLVRFLHPKQHLPGLVRFLHPKQHLPGLVRFPISKSTTCNTAKFFEVKTGSYFIPDT
jgi:hypothetical protein